jgi:hypothetical protein
MQWQVLIRWASALALLAAVAGCGGSKKAVPVKGTVTMDGKPVSLASVVFVPQKEGGPLAQAMTNDNGDFELTTFQPNDGALPGEYNITVTKVDEMPLADLSDLPDGMTPDQIMQKVVPRVMAEKAKHKQKAKKPSKEIPSIYGNAKKTPLKCRVPVDGKVDLKLHANMKGS